MYSITIITIIVIIYIVICYHIYEVLLVDFFNPGLMQVEGVTSHSSLSL